MGEVAKIEEAMLPASADQSAALLNVIHRAATDPSVDIDKMERLLAMQERVLARNAESAFNDAMNAAQSEMRRVAADAYNNQTRSHYPTYAAMDRALRPIYTAHGFAISFDTGADAPEGTVVVLAYVSHRAGHTRTYRATMPADGKGAKGGDVMTKTHAAGAGMSYGMRYLLKMIFNVAIGEDDTDGNDPRDIPECAPELLETARAEAMNGTEAFRSYWKKIGHQERKSLAQHMDSLREAATAADAK